MSVNDNTEDNDNNHLALSHPLIGNQVNQIEEVNDLKNRLSFNDFFYTLVAKVSNNPDKCNVWNYVLLDMIENNVINESMLSDVLRMTTDATRSESVANREFSCHMVSKLSRRLNERVFMDRILPLVQYLCQDLQPSIRAHISRQMFVLSQNFSLQIIKTQILPKLMDMTNDSELIVRIASLESLIDLIPKFDDEFNKQIILPQIISIFDLALVKNDCSLSFIFMNFAKLCQTLPKNVISREKWFLDYYCNIFLISNDFQMEPKVSNFTERDAQCRTLLAVYFPILLQIYGSNDTLFSILNFLCCDLDISVIRAISSVFNEICILMKNPFVLYPQLSKLMSQRNIIVIKALSPSLATILINTIKSTPIDKKNELFVDLIQNLIGCENTICLNLDWRLQIKFYENLIQVLVHFPVNIVQTVFLPLLLNRILTSRPIPSRIETSRCLLILFLNLPVLSEVFNIYQWFVTTLCCGQSWSQRMLFINVCYIIIELCDENIFISYFLEPLLSLRTDKVPNIRLNVCKCLKTLKPLLKSPELSVRIAQTKDMFKEMLSSERDRDVIDSINQLVDELDRNLDNHMEEEELKVLVEEFIQLTIDSSLNNKPVIEVNNNSVVNSVLNSVKKDSMKPKSSLPQLIRSQYNSNSVSKCLPRSHNMNGFHSIPSKIPKPITKCSK